MKFTDRRTQIHKQTKRGTSRRTQRHSKTPQIRSVAYLNNTVCPQISDYNLPSCGVLGYDHVIRTALLGPSGGGMTPPSLAVHAAPPVVARAPPKRILIICPPTWSAGPPGWAGRADQRDREIGKGNPWGRGLRRGWRGRNRKLEAIVLVFVALRLRSTCCRCGVIINREEWGKKREFLREISKIRKKSSDEQL